MAFTFTNKKGVKYFLHSKSTSRADASRPSTISPRTSGPATPWMPFPWATRSGPRPGMPILKKA
jgi:hypothetical protein